MQIELECNYDVTGVPMSESSIGPGGAAKGGLGFISKYLTVWILLAMAAGIILGNVYPQIVPLLDSVRVEEVSLPIAIGLDLDDVPAAGGGKI